MKANFIRASVVLALLGLGLSGNAYADNDDGNSGFYAEVGGSLSTPSDVDAPFTSTLGTDVNWDTSGAVGVKLKLGWDFGKIRSDLKISAYEGGVDTIDSVTASRDDFWFGSATLNGYWDIVNKKVGKRLSITPYVGLGVGAVGGYIRASSVLADGSGATRRDNRRDIALAGRAMIGAQLHLSKHVGFTMGYDLLVGGIEGSTFTNHALELGLRLTF
ncbi:MAG: outer membrane beta-barrel protein [Rhodospirillaceae bacterium]|jgi:hypothetical protein|nr:outer membrane beta-barrel protein [Rhodospirillales bacterium]MBT3907217.1 outer membrane beta-barrel protein [Rhodospirillaceae bacterium]MBT4702148.1 outer membrane beta-barrel protein [Rhodospirillaceae bacterium]MBT5036173.1 outer membrane beta-barrel protein [Rhodospirillaceae bacterium]MBT6218622.1 outer membrane beta-barrel protein [Rhodospirillaceae bacterium]